MLAQITINIHIETVKKILPTTILEIWRVDDVFDVIYFVFY